jgi:hypothetical protein
MDTVLVDSDAVDVVMAEGYALFASSKIAQVGGGLSTPHGFSMIILSKASDSSNALEQEGKT